MDLKRTGIALIAIAALGSAQSQTEPRFEIASIKAADPSAPAPGRMNAAIVTTPGMLKSKSTTLKGLIEAAYALQGDYQVSGGPGWLGSTRFDVEAKPADPAGRDQLLLMLRTLLADRFKLACHRETKELPVYALVVAKNGPKFQRLKPGAESEPGKLNRLGRNADLAWFAMYLTRYGSDKPVIDKTGLTGSFNLDLDMEKIAASMAAESQGPPTIGRLFEATANAIEDQLGLKLMPTKAAIQVLVIDHAERPSAN